MHSGSTGHGNCKLASSGVIEKSEETYFAEFENGLARLANVLTRAVADDACRRVGEFDRDDEQARRRERLGAGLVALLGFFDDEPHWAHVLLLDLPEATAGSRICKQRLYDLLGGLVNDRAHQAESGGTQSLCSQALTVELVFGGVFSLIAERLREPGRARLVELAPSLSSFVATAYLGQIAASPESDVSRGSDAGAEQRAARSPERPVRATYRTACVLRAISAAPRSSNRAVAQAAGLTDEGQTSKLLGRLERRGAIQNVGLGAAYGEPNEWLLTPYGQSIVNAIGHGFALDATGRGRRRVRGAA